MTSHVVSKTRQNILIVILILAIFCADVLSKKWIMQHMDYGDAIPLTSFFKLIFTVNRGVSFSMFTMTQTQGVYFLIALTGGVAAFVLYLLLKSKNFMERLSFSFIFAGALGNIFDRIQLGGVVDFLYFHYKTYYWPAFNIADIFICFGVALLFFYYFMVQKKEIE